MGNVGLRLLDSYCCEGEASRGYADAGLAVQGVDLFEDFTQARYPWYSHRGDAIAYIKKYGHLFDVHHASPPCQHATIATSALRGQGREYPELIEPTREALIATGKPYVIENVRGSRLIDPVKLCGCMFDLTAKDADGLPLRMERERWFEVGGGLTITAPRECSHDDDVWVAGSYGGSRKAKRKKNDDGTFAETLAEVAPRDRHEAKYVREGGYVPRSKEVVEQLMGVDWMTWKGLHQALPPAYTAHIGSQMMEQLT